MLVLKGTRSVAATVSCAYRYPQPQLPVRAAFRVAVCHAAAVSDGEMIGPDPTHEATGVLRRAACTQTRIWPVGPVGLGTVGGRDARRSCFGRADIQCQIRCTDPRSRPAASGQEAQDAHYERSGVSEVALAPRHMPCAGRWPLGRSIGSIDSPSGGRVNYGSHRIDPVQESRMNWASLGRARHILRLNRMNQERCGQCCRSGVAGPKRAHACRHTRATDVADGAQATWAATSARCCCATVATLSDAICPPSLQARRRKQPRHLALANPACYCR